MIVLVIILSTICIFLLLICLNLYYKTKTYEVLINDSNDYYVNSIQLLDRMITLFSEAKARLIKIDNNGSFSTDDEVGFVFKLIDSTIIEVSSRLDQIKDILQDAEIKE